MPSHSFSLALSKLSETEIALACNCIISYLDIYMINITMTDMNVVFL